MLGDRLKELRIDHLLSLSDLAEIVGKSKSTISRYENNQITKLDLDLIEKMAATLHTSSAYLLGMTDNSHSTPKSKTSELLLDEERLTITVKDNEMAPEIPMGAHVQIRELQPKEKLTAGSYYYIEFNQKKCLRLAVNDPDKGIRLMPLNMSEQRIAFDKDYVTFLGKAVLMTVYL